jgi:phage tail sheath protein FI
MPEYLAPGVFVEETSFRSKSIEGVSTTTTGFIGPSRYGPVTVSPDVVTSLGEFERIYAGGTQLIFRDVQGNEQPQMDNFLWHGVRAFFSEGGKRLYITRVFRPLHATLPYPLNSDLGEENLGTPADPVYRDGHARPSPGNLAMRSRFPGSASNMIVVIGLKAGQNILGAQPAADGQGFEPKLGALADRDLVFIERRPGSPPGSPESPSGFAVAQFEPTGRTWNFQFIESSPGNPVGLNALNLVATPEANQGDLVSVITATVQIFSADRAHDLGTWTLLPLDPNHQRFGFPDSIFSKFAPSPASLSEARSLPIVLGLADEDDTGVEVLHDMFSAPTLAALDLTDDQISRDLTATSILQSGSIEETFELRGGNDGQRPASGDYEGREEEQTSIDFPLPYKTGLKQFEDVEDISIVAAPGCTAEYQGAFRAEANAILGLLINHAQRMRYRIAVLDSPPGMSVGDVRRVRAKLDSSYAALYYPWVTVLDPVTRAELNLPPSGFVSGIYARNDVERAVWKAPANEVVNLAIGFEQLINKAQQEVLNPEGVNCFRFFEGRGFRLWGARTISSDPEWKYVNLRRYFAYLERSIDKGTQWAVFEPNGEALWGNIRRTIEDFLLNQWQSGALLGEKPEKAYFVKCDRSTMTQNDLDNGRLICLVGVAPLRPAEFVIFRIGQWTADHKV